MKNIISFILFIFSGLIIHYSAHAQETEMVFVSILPQRFFVQQISGSALKVEVMVLPGASPATYEPKPSQMRKLASSKAYFALGVPFENSWIDKISGVNPAMKIVHTDEGIQKLTMVEHHHEETDTIQEDHHQNDSHHDDHQPGLDPHIWLSPVLVKTQAKSILSNLLTLFPHHAALFHSNYQSFISQLNQLHEETKQALAHLKGKRFMVFHPSWGYFAQEYGLEQIAIEVEGKSAKPAQMKELIQQAKELGIDVIFAQSQFSSKSAKIIAREIGGRVVLVDPLAEDYFANMKKVARELGRAAR